MKKSTIYIVMATLCFFINAKAQIQNIIKPLKIGDTIPEAIWNIPLQVVNHSEGKKTIKLSEYRNKKLIIIEFWATWCSPCIASLDSTFSIYKTHKDEIMLLPVASHQGSSIRQAEKLMEEKHWEVPSVIDTKQYLFTKVFPPTSGTGIPHMVWIRDGKVFAIPKSNDATENNISRAIYGEKSDMEMDTVNYFPLDYRRPLFVKNNGETALYFENRPYSVISRYVPGYGTGGKTEFLKIADTSILATVNRPLKYLLFDAYKSVLFPGLDADNGIVWNISDSLRNRLFNNPKFDQKHNLNNDIARNKWLNKNTYGYNLRFPENIKETEAYYFMQQDLSRFFGVYLNLNFSIELTIKHKYAVLKLLGTKQQSIELLRHKGKKTGSEKFKGVKYYYNVDYSQSFLVKLIQAIPEITIKSIIDMTGISPDLKVDYKLSQVLPSDIKKLNVELKPYGVELAIEEKFVPMLFVREEKTAGVPTRP